MIKQFIPEDACLRCQGCCRFVDSDSVWLPCLLDEEIQELLDKKIPPACISMDRKIQPIPNPEGEGYICAFLEKKNNKCRIYSFRPFECQLYPFLINFRNNKVILTVDLNCPYIREHLDSKEFKDYTQYLADFLNSPRQLEMLRDSPHLLQAYEDVSEIIELKIFDETKDDLPK